MSASPDTERTRSHVVVKAPRDTDAIGGSLRNAFATTPALPADLRALLSRIN